MSDADFTFTIDGKTISGKPGQTIMEAADEAQARAIMRGLQALLAAEIIEQEAMEEAVQSDLGSGPLASLTADAVSQGLTGDRALRFVASNLSGAGPQIDRRHLVDADKRLLLTIEQMTAIMRVLGVAPPAPAAATRRQWSAVIGAAWNTFTRCSIRSGA